MSEKASANRARQACEPCRRKKTKCPGEKPVCSFCERLGQRCSYERGDEAAARVHKTRRSGSHDSNGSRDRLHRLESRIEEVFDILSNISNSGPRARVSVTHPNTQPQETLANESMTPAQASSNSGSNSQTPIFDAVRNQEPPEELWPAMIEIYKTRFDCQPLTVLGPRTLSVPPSKWPKALRRSFLSLTIPFINNHDFFNGCRDEAIAFYAKSARSEVLRGATEGQIDLAILQASCLSALREIIASNPLAAWMTISIGIRLALSLRVMSNKHEPKITIDQDSRSRICWSLFTLDGIYGTTLTVPPSLSTDDMLPNFPASAACPDPAGQANDLPLQNPPIKDLGVSAYYLQLLSIWKMGMKYVQSVKDGELDDAWTVGSQYQNVMARLFDFETKYAQVHRFQQNRIEDHDLQTLESQRNYWAPWLSGQFIFHAVQGLINHPFLHIASRSQPQSFSPPSFLQNSIDQAVLHSSWILKCIEVTTETGFVVHDPFLAHLTAVNATIYLFLLNAKDGELASQARLGFESCFSFVQKQTDSWPHLRHTIDKLNILQHAAITSSSVPANRSAPTAQRSLLWELLDYSASTMPSQVPEFASDAVDLNVDTRFLSPLNPLSSGHTPATAMQRSDSQPQPADVTQQISEPFWDPTMNSFDFNLFGNEQITDLTNLTFGRDIWSLGQL